MRPEYPVVAASVIMAIVALLLFVREREGHEAHKRELARVKELATRLAADAAQIQPAPAPQIQPAPQPLVFSTHFVAEFDDGTWDIWRLSEIALAGDRNPRWHCRTREDAVALMDRLDKIVDGEVKP